MCNKRNFWKQKNAKSAVAVAGLAGGREVALFLCRPPAPGGRQVPLISSLPLSFSSSFFFLFFLNPIPKFPPIFDPSSCSSPINHPVFLLSFSLSLSLSIYRYIAPSLSLFLNLSVVSTGERNRSVFLLHGIFLRCGFCLYL